MAFAYSSRSFSCSNMLKSTFWLSYLWWLCNYISNHPGFKPWCPTSDPSLSNLFSSLPTANFNHIISLITSCLENDVPPHSTPSFTHARLISLNYSPNQFTFLLWNLLLSDLSPDCLCLTVHSPTSIDLSSCISHLPHPRQMGCFFLGHTLCFLESVLFDSLAFTILPTSAAD